MRYIIHLTLLIYLSLPGHSQKRETIILKKYTQKDGLSSYNVRKVIQDKWGFVWAATQDGLSRFDGAEFVNYTKTAALKKRLSGTDIRELIEDPDENLIWVLPGEVGINAIHSITGEVKITARIPYSGNDDWNISMLKNDKELWVGTSTGIKIFDIKRERFENLTLLPPNSDSSVKSAVRSIAKDKYGNIWGCYDRYGIIIYDSKTRRVITQLKLTELNDHRKSNEIRFLSYTLLNNSILFSTSQGLRKIIYSSSYQIRVDNTPCESFPKLNTESISFCASDKENKILISGTSQLFRFNNSLTAYEHLEEPGRINETDWLNAVQSLYIDKDKNIWLGCQEGLAFISSKQMPFEPYNYDKISNTKLDHVRSLCALTNGDILVGLISGIVQIDNSSKRYKKYDTGRLYHHIFEDKRGNIHVSRPDGMFIYKKGLVAPITLIYPEFSSYSSIAINSHLFIGDSIIILGSENNNGILVWNYVQKKVTKMVQGHGESTLASDIVNNIYRDSRSNIWVLSDNVITVLSEKLKKIKEIILTDKQNYLPYKLYFDMCEAEGYYWINSYGSGVLQLDKGFNLVNVVNTSTGLSNDGVYQIHKVTATDLLITSNYGLSLLNTKNLRIKKFFSEDGLHGSAFEEVCGTSKDGLVYAGGVNGFTIINPSKIQLNKAPPTLYFTETKIDFRTKRTETSDLLINSVTVPINWLQTNISFVGLNYLNPQRVTYQYRINERDNSWRDLGYQRFVNLIGLQPGTYTLEIKAINEDGFESPTKTLKLNFKPKWYQTTSFRIGVIITIAAIFYAVYRNRINQIKAQQQIRKDIASDLHDDIGSTLNTVKNFTHLARREPSKQTYLEQIEISLTEATTGLRDMLWVLDDTQDTPYEFMERIKKFALPVLNANNIKFETVIEAHDNKVFTKTEKRNLLLICKEAINNSIKYAACNKIMVSIELSNWKTSLLIRDNGKGFDTTSETEGNGLKNMYERARQIKYQVSIISNSGEGTSIKLIKKS